MLFDVTNSGDQFDAQDAITLLTGNTTVTGHGTGSQATLFRGPSNRNYEIVGDVSNLEIESGSDLTVIGSVTNCILADSTANIRQFFHTLDTQQLLDADEAGDDDLKLEKPALDNAVELQTG